ncbi:CDP-diacylglycerol--serine O-phosphatidyltransferase [Synoicihabitans lomoniglobus]|uniref:CDP-diacylglycerol--serine O-phosphatidyltransferase n=1 Tax=Synoicihabitans lomoniglobus TaxID=2909285 RepID=A0AAE9ZWR3_9BACT|nr:CDP-diacylglycerol--serine O-phosphatidyltransferase [Opitutaceae bacterium LMO-M01]WED64499.1 CDP-diacylglycerol--serine O-phosphatidyltransferase [Opitutaceae bacterium LMO-M01]
MSTDAPDAPTPDPEDPFTAENASRIYFLPNLMTAGNLFCGFVACIKCVQAHYLMRGADVITPGASELFSEAVWLIFGAMAFDVLDGRLARMGGRESLFGGEFDSLADMVSFGLTPALMMFFLILSPTQGYPIFQKIGWFFGFVYLLCAAIRLARFNVITHPLITRNHKPASKDFIGLPVPAAAGTVAALVLFLLNLAKHDRELQMWALALPPLLILIAVLMVSRISYPSGKQIDMQTKTPLTSFVLFLAAASAIVAFKEVGMLVVMLGYIFWGIYRSLRSRSSNAENV